MPLFCANLSRMDRLVIATHNLKKGKEMVDILTPAIPGLEVLTLSDFPGAPEPRETGMTYAENARIKAQSASAWTGEWALADDAGLEIDYFDGAPGVWSKRFEGEDTSFQEKMRRILERMDGVPESERGARFRCSIALAASDDSTPLVFEATCEGRIAMEPSGSGGFGYDPIFYLPDQGCTMADLTAHQKHAISHRGKVLRQFVEYLRTKR